MSSDADVTEEGEGAGASLLAPLRVGDRLPWRLDRNGEPQWLVVVATQGRGEHLVRYPSGRIEKLVDTD